MKFSYKLVATGLIIIFAATVVISLTSNWWFANKITDQQTDRRTNQWQTFRHEKFNFTFQYPPEAIVDISSTAVSEEPKRIRVRHIGPESEPNTEITDGFTFYVRSDSLNEQESLTKAANRILKEETEHREIINKLTATNLNGRNTYTFSVHSELGGEVTYTVLEDEGNTVFITSGTVSIPDGAERDYAPVIKKMQKSIQKSG